MRPVSISGFFDMLSQSQKLYSRQLEPVCRKWDLTRSEVDVLLFLHNNPGYDRAADIVARRGMVKSHVSMSVASLEQRGLLERCFSQTDRRTAHLHLTQQGSAVAAEARSLQRDYFESIYSGITEEEFEIWEQMTRKIWNNIHKLSKQEKE